MPRDVSYSRIQAKHTANPVDEQLLKLKRKQTTAHLVSSSLPSLSTVTRSTVQRAKTSPENLTPAELRQLQGTVGNRALSRLIAQQTTQAHAAVSTGPVMQRTPILVKQRTLLKKPVQRWKLPWRKNETDQQKLERYTNTMDNITTAIDVLRVGHGLVMLPVTVIDLLSNIARPFTGHKARLKSSSSKKEENRKVFHNVLNGESQLVALMAGKNAYFDLKILHYMPWNIIPWIIGALRRWHDKLQKKRITVYNRINNIAGGKKSL